MDFFINNALLIMFLPLFVILIIITRNLLKVDTNKKITVSITLLSTFIGLVFSLALFNHVRIPSPMIIEKNLLWLSFDSLKLYIGTLIDSTSTSFLVVLMFISFLIQLYSFGYLKDKKELNKYYTYLNFLNFSMIGAILSTNLFQTYLFWELVGIASYLLINLFQKKDNTKNDYKSVFIINKIGDTAFLLGIIIFIYFSITYLNQPNAQILTFTKMNTITTELSLSAYPIISDLACILIVIGALIKSAQFPMHFWLINATKSPSSINAIIHSATIVCLGVFLIIRIYPILNIDLLNIILFIGIITSLLCAFIATTQTNIKKILAYSTASQFGLIFTAIGLFSIQTAIIYLIIHAFTKAQLFFCAGMIEQKYDEIEDMTQMGDLRKKDFYIALYWLVSSLSLSGLFFGGFTSKEMLLNIAHNSNNLSILFMILLTLYLTAFYIFRAYFMIFENYNKKETQISTKKEKAMTAAMTILCFFIILPGLIFKFSNLNYLSMISIAIGALAIVNAYASYKCSKVFMPNALYKLSYNELYIPQIYNFVLSPLKKKN